MDNPKTAPLSVLKSSTAKQESLDFTVRTFPTITTRKEPTLLRAEKLNRGLSTEQKELYRNYRKGLSKDEENFSIARLALSETFIFDTLSRVLKKIAQKALQEEDKEALGKFIPPKEPVLRYIAHIIFVLRQTIIGSVVPTETEARYIRAILSDEQMKEYMIEALGEKDSHARIQALRAPKILAIQHPIIQSLVGDDISLSQGALTHLFGNFSQYFPTNMEEQTKAVAITERDFDSDKVIQLVPALRLVTFVTAPKKQNVVTPFRTATALARMEQNSHMWHELPIGEITKKFSFTNIRDFHAILPLNDAFPHIIRKHGPCTYSVKKVSLDSHIAMLAGEKSFERTLRNIFKTAELKKFNTRPDVRIPAAILLDLMDGTTLASGEIEFVSEILANATFIQTFGMALGKLQSDSRIGDFNIVKYPHLNTDAILHFFQKKLERDSVSLGMEERILVAA